MPTRRPLAPVVALALFALAAAWVSAADAATLKPYRSEAEFTEALQRWTAQSQRLQADRQREATNLALSMAPKSMPAPAPTAGAMQDSSSARASAAAPAGTAAGTAADTAAESITNVQTAGVDEGGIVKRAGDHLVVLRRGRLFTVRVGGDQLQPVATLDAFAPGSDPRGSWYDELLISGRQLVVIGYSYARGGTEIGLFDLGDDGSLAYRATYHLRSFDYWSSRNYASRLIGNKLVFYTPTVLQPWGAPLAQMLPALRRWSGGVPADFERILPATRIFRTDDEFSPGEPLALHTVTSCELGAAALRCDASAVLGPAGRVFYVSAGSVYVWTNSGRRRWTPPGERPERAEPPLSAVFRLPLDGSAPSGLKTAGVPVDQMSFLEDAQGHLNVLLREQGEGDGMAGGERSRGALAVLRMPLTAFGDGKSAAAREFYRRVPGPVNGALQNRYVGDWLLWGSENGAWALAYARPGTAVALAPTHAVERIEALGEHAVLVGNAGSELRFTALRLTRGEPRLAGRHAIPEAQQGETRTHGFFYRATGAERGLLGLPVVTSEGGRAPGMGRTQAAASVVFLRHAALAFTALGELAARPGRVIDDACKASCVDWYGNARPIFLGDRVLALMGYEIVEGRLADARGDEHIEERRRISFAPLQRGRGERPSPFE